MEFEGNKLLYFVIEQDRRLVDLLSLQSEQGESERLPDFDYSDVFRGSDVEGRAYDLFVLGLGNHNAPRRLLPAGIGGPGPR